MDTQFTELSVRSLLEIDLHKFLEGVHFSSSNCENLDILIKTITHFRTQIIPVYQDFSQKLRAKSMLLEGKYKYILEDLRKLHDNTEDMVKNVQRLAEKLDYVKNKQLNILSRAETLFFEAKNRDNILSDAEGQFASDLGKIESRMKELQTDIEAAREKKKVLDVQESHWNKESDKYYLHDWQLNIIKDSLNDMGLEIEHVLHKLNSLGENINDNEI